MTSKESAV